MTMFSDWMVQVWENGEWSDYWPVTVKGTSRAAAVKRAPRVLCGRWRERYHARSLKWRVGRRLREIALP